MGKNLHKVINCTFPGCLKQGIRSNRLKAHLASHHGLSRSPMKRERCLQCEKMITTKNKARHQRTHHKEGVNIKQEDPSPSSDIPQNENSIEERMKEDIPSKPKLSASKRKINLDMMQIHQTKKSLSPSPPKQEDVPS